MTQFSAPLFYHGDIQERKSIAVHLQPEMPRLSRGRHERCPKCGQRFSVEPGFYFGAAYVSYALNVALVVASCVAVYVLHPDPEPHHYVIALVSVILLLLPATFRLSRIIWATMFIPFGGEKKQMAKKKGESA
jgi:hypothetical protein